MDALEFIAKTDRLIRKKLALAPPYLTTALYSYGRRFFIDALAKNPPKFEYFPPEDLKRKIWGAEFRAPIFNAAGVFKKGEGYETVYRQGAGAFLAGTATPRPRKGNAKFGIRTPFVPYPRSKAASNWMGLPNEGYSALAARIEKIEKKRGCPIGVSLSADPLSEGETAARELAEGLALFEKTKADFIEINESCPNTEARVSAATEGSLDPSLAKRLEIVSEKFLKKRQRNLPVVVKFSTDLLEEDLPSIINALIELGFDGINLGNTSVNRDFYAAAIDESEKKLFEYFGSNFGGGLSGSLLKKRSLRLSAKAAELIAKANLSREFVAIRTGGVENFRDLLASEKAGVALNQWFTGYFEAFAQFGHKLYKNLFENSVD